MLSYVIVGSGYRAEYYGRIASTYPELFRALFLCRSEEKAAQVYSHTGIRATTALEDCLAFRPDFVVVAVDRGHIFEVTEEWVLRGFPVVAETPVADSEEKLKKIRDLAANGAKIVCCEQYHRYPILAAGLKALKEGRIGEPSSMYISLLHDYHAASLIWKAMGIRPGESWTISGTRQTNRVTETDSRYGAILDGRTKEAERDIVRISFESGKEVIYDFCPVQYRSYIRSRHLTVRGDRGEWSDTVISFLDAKNEPQKIFLLPEIEEKYRVLDTQALRDKRRNWLFELAPDTVQDEFAVASILLDMGEYLAGGPSPYPIQQAMNDALFWLMLNRAVQDPEASIGIGYHSRKK